MRFGFVFLARDLKAVGPIASLGEEQGFDLIGLCDSPSLCFDPFIGLSLAAERTHQVRLGTAVTNPQTRHPLVLANLAAGLEQLAPGRSFLGIGTGNSAVRHAGARPANLETLADAVETIRSLLEGQVLDFGGSSETRLPGDCKRVPIMMAGSGPRALRLAGRLADVVFVNLGVLPEVVADGYGWVREGAEAAGRDPAELELWVYVPGAVDTDREQAIDEIKGAAVAIAAYVLRGDPQTKRVPPEIAPRVERLLRDYDYGEHLTPGHSSTYHLADRVGIADYLLDRFTIAGAPDDCGRKIEELRRAGVENVCLSFGAAPDVAAYVRLFGQTVALAFANAKG
jgi:5,10-methylenetetrahydromethanopterin reductase